MALHTIMNGWGTTPDIRSGEVPRIAGQTSESANASQVTGQTSESANASQVSSVDQLYDLNRQFAVDQAQKQMDYQTSANKIAMDFSAAEAAKQRVYSTEMANTAYQRAVQDLRKAGLNPALAYQQGGAAVPSVSAASGVTSGGSMAVLADTGYKKFELEQELEIEKAKITQAYVETFVNAATDVVTTAMDNSASKSVASIGAKAKAVAAGKWW